MSVAGEDMTESVEQKSQREVAEPRPLNPRQYFSGFLGSSEFLQKKAERLEQVRLRNPNLDEEDTQDATNAYLRTDEVKDLFWQYFRQNPFKYDPVFFSQDFNFKLNGYFTELKKIRSKERLMRGPQSPDEMMEQDELRSAKHTVASQQLLEDGMAPNFTLARLLVHMITVTEDLDKEDPNRDRRVREVLAARR
ncbi:hypothetical protein HYW46_02075 [Candidatus Daviesbacteria bacterium]|nr:hypothetical protein [Candidatus Daviesbacteria bacterium]